MRVALGCWSFPPRPTSPAAWWTAPAGTAARQWQPLRQDLALPIDLTLESGSAFGSLSLAYSGFNVAQPDFGMAVLRTAYLLAEGPCAPDLAVGLGLATIDGESTEDCVRGSCYVFGGSGPAFSFEGGFPVFRANRFGRVTLSAQLLVPLFTATICGRDAASAPAMVFSGVRLQL